MTDEPLGQRVKSLADWNDGSDEAPTNYTHDCLLFQQDLRAVLAANAALTAERDALRDEWDKIAAGITTGQPDVGALWPMVSEINGGLSATRLLLRNEIASHNQTKAERDAALARAVAAEAQAGRLREALAFYSNPQVYAPHPHGPAFDRRDLSSHAIAALASETGAPA